MNQVTHCCNCNTTTIRHFAQVPDRHYGIKGIFNLSQCENCKLVFMNPMPTASELAAFYPEESYYSYHVDIYKETSDFKKFLIRLACLDSTPKDVRFKTPGSVLDIGCGNGWNLYQYKKQGWEVAGVEPSKVGATIGNQAGLNIFNGDLLDASFKSDSFDYIRLNHSFEHIHNPREVLSEIYRILKPGGKLFIGVPNIDSFNAKLFKNYWYHLGAPVHTFSYSPATLSSLLTQHDFKVEKVQYNSNWAGSIGSFQIYMNRKSGKSSDKGFFMNATPFKMISGAFAKLLNVFQAGDCMEIIASKEHTY